MAEFSLFPTSIGQCGIAWHGGVVIATHLPEQSPVRTAARLAARVAASQSKPPPDIQHAIDAITRLLEGAKTDLTDIVCDFRSVKPFAARVYEITRAIPAGETLTYGDIALQLGDKRLAQGVGSAMGRNPFPIIVPCHRVVGANGKLTGFSAHGGIDTKLKMLMIEGAQVGGSPGLFDHLPSN